jgi:hypothetical protein
MRELVICGWNVGFHKILLTKTLRIEFGYPLTTAKSITDRVLSKEEIRIPLNHLPFEEENLLRRLREIGVKVSVES